MLNALDAYLADPEMIAAYISRYHLKRRELAATKITQLRSIADRLPDLDKQIESIVDQIVERRASDALFERLQKLEAERADLRTEAESLKADDEPIVLHPAAADRYRQLINELRMHLEGLREGQPRDLIFERLRSMIEKVVITPNGARQPVDIQVHGLLAELLVDKKETPLDARAFRGAMVAGARYRHCTKRKPYPAVSDNVLGQQDKRCFGKQVLDAGVCTRWAVIVNPSGFHRVGRALGHSKHRVQRSRRGPDRP